MMTKTDELLMILDIANSQGRLTDMEYCRAIDLLIGDQYPIEFPLDVQGTYEELSTGGQND